MTTENQETPADGTAPAENLPENGKPKSSQPEGEKPRQIMQVGLFNFVLTVGLLVFGIVSIFQNLNDFSHPGDVINQALASMHANSDKFPDVTYVATSTTALVGGMLLTLQGANFGLIAWWAVTRLRSGKVSFWVPIVGAAISSTLTFIAMILLMLSDVTVMNAITAFMRASAGV